MTTAWELIQRRIEKRFGKAYGPMSTDIH